MRAATEGSLPPVMPQGNLVEVLGREVRQGSPGELMVDSTPSRQRRPPCKKNKEESDEAADAAALTYLLTSLSPSNSRSSTVIPALSPMLVVVCGLVACIAAVLRRTPVGLGSHPSCSSSAFVLHRVLHPDSMWSVWELGQC